MKIRLLLMLIFFAGISSSHAENAMWSARTSFGIAVFNERMWVLGGANFDIEINPKEGWTPYNDVWSTADGVKWEKTTAAAPWMARDGLSAVVFKNKLWIFGGRTKDGLKNDIWSTADGRKWECVTEHAPWAPLARSEFIVFKDKIFLFKEWAGYEKGEDEVWFSNDGKAWTKGPKPAWESVNKISATIFNGELYILCCHNERDSYIRNSIWRSKDGIRWEQILKDAPFKRVYASLFAYYGRLLLVGGKYGDDAYYGSDIWTSHDGVEWKQSNPQSNWRGRCLFGITVFLRRLWIMGGTGETGSFDDVWSSYDWTTWLPGNYPGRRFKRSD